MSASNIPNSGCEKVIPMLFVSEISAALDFYLNKLGFSHGFTWGEPPVMAGVNLNNVSIHLYKSDPRENRVYFVVDDADEMFEYHQRNGVEIIHHPDDREYEMRDYAIKDPWGNQLGFGHYIQLRTPPLMIDRVDVPARIEKRLAHLLTELAEHKNMTIGSCLEETLLHTFEVIGNDQGVASPHTKKTHAFIQELKKKYGIDYDVHASYRFVEKLQPGNEITGIE